MESDKNLYILIIVGKKISTTTNKIDIRFYLYLFFFVRDLAKILEALQLC